MTTLLDEVKAITTFHVTYHDEDGFGFSCGTSMGNTDNLFRLFPEASGTDIRRCSMVVLKRFMREERGRLYDRYYGRI